MLPVRTRLYWPGEMPPYGYFLTSGIASVVAGLNDGGTAEVAVIGNEGLVGALHIIGPIALCDFQYLFGYQGTAGPGSSVSW